jgi:thiamine-phosphate pyrophosphorylase
MRPDHPVPRTWLMTDERQGEGLWLALERVPVGGGVVLRHYSLTAEARRALFRAVRRVARRRGLTLLLAGDASTARCWGADGWHGRGRGAGFHSAPVHDPGELRAAERSGASLLFVSPVYPTRSHPGAPHLGEAGLAALARHASVPVIALGGVTAPDAARLRLLGAYGWAGIDAWGA